MRKIQINLKWLNSYHQSEVCTGLNNKKTTVKLAYCLSQDGVLAKSLLSTKLKTAEKTPNKSLYCDVFRTPTETIASDQPGNGFKEDKNFQIIQGIVKKCDVTFHHSREQTYFKLTVVLDKEPPKYCALALLQNYNKSSDTYADYYRSNRGVRVMLANEKGEPLLKGEHILRIDSNKDPDWEELFIKSWKESTPECRVALTPCIRLTRYWGGLGSASYVALPVSNTFYLPTYSEAQEAQHASSTKSKKKIREEECLKLIWDSPEILSAPNWNKAKSILLETLMPEPEMAEL